MTPAQAIPILQNPRGLRFSEEREALRVLMEFCREKGWIR
jgi:hypothetical protein